MYFCRHTLRYEQAHESTREIFASLCVVTVYKPSALLFMYVLIINKVTIEAFCLLLCN